MGEQFEQLLPQVTERLGKSARELAERGLQRLTVGGVDHSQHGLGLGEIEPTSEKGPQREFAGLGNPGTVAAESGHGQFQERWRAYGMQFGTRLPRIAVLARPQEQVARQRGASVSEQKHAGNHLGEGDRWSGRHSWSENTPQPLTGHWGR